MAHGPRPMRQGPNEMRLSLMAVMLLLLGGCAVGPDYEPPQVDVPEGWRVRVDYQTAADLANTAWWEAFDDPVLNDLIVLALSQNKDLRIAAARIQEFAGRLRIARAGFYPQIGYGVGADRTQSSELAPPLPAGVDPISNTYSATINIGWELDVWGRIRRASEAARAELLAAEEGRRTVILTLVSSVATGYIALRGLDQRLVIAKQTAESRRKSLDLFELQYAGGVASQLTLAQVRSEYEQALAAIPDLERQIEQLENALSVLLGRNPGPIPRGKPIDELLLPPVPEGIPSELLERRPDLRFAEQNLIAANARIGVAKAEYFPRISLTGLFGYASQELSDLFTKEARLWGVGASAIGPIFTGGSVSGQVQVTEAIQRQSLEGYLQAIQTAFREVNDALIDNEKSHQQLAAQGRRVEALKEYAELARLRFDNGYSSYIDVLDSERSLFNAQLAYVQTQSGVYASLVNIYKALGGGWVVKAEQIVDAAAEARARAESERAAGKSGKQ
jgi:multidrug efflux system outer membrane protein